MPKGAGQEDIVFITQVIQVDELDKPIGILEKMAAHREGALHRAVSVFIFNQAGEWLLQQRAMGKYHSPGLWSNACCTHPTPGEANLAAAQRRLNEELGIKAPLKELFSFTYRDELDHDLIEHEFDHVFAGFCDAVPAPDPEEVMAFRYVPFEHLKQEINKMPNHFTTWFLRIYSRVADLVPPLFSCSDLGTIRGIKTRRNHYGRRTI